MFSSKIILLDKPQFITSAQVLNRVKKILNIKKLGHIGTLDPIATGLLVLASDEATKLIRFINKCTKVYDFTITFGIHTDSYDVQGTVIAQNDVYPTKMEIQAALPGFIGKIRQIPPIYSAIKINGKRAYQYARDDGCAELEMAERAVEVFSLELLEHGAQSSKFRAHVSAGTYIRSLCIDIAASVGAIGCITELRRLACAKFLVKNAISLDVLERTEYNKKTNFDGSSAGDAVADADADVGPCARSVISIEEAFDYVLGDIPVYQMPDNLITRFRCGQRVRITDLPFACAADNGFFAVRAGGAGLDGHIIGVAEYDNMISKLVCLFNL